MLLRHWDISLKSPGQAASNIPSALRANEFHLATVLDLASNAYYVALVRPEIWYWQQRMHQRTASAPQLGAFIRRLIEALEKVPHAKYEEDLEHFAPDLPAGFRGVRMAKLTMTRAATEAARYALHCYRFTRKVPLVYSDEIQDRLDIGKLIDVSLGLRHALQSLPLLRRAEPQLHLGQLTEEEIRKVLREVGVYFAQMPSFEDRREETKILV